MIRFIAGVAQRYQLDLCDEIGLLVYEESFAGWCLGDSPQMAERFDDSTLGMVRRDRNHPSIVIWGLLNETGDGPRLPPRRGRAAAGPRTGRYPRRDAQQRPLGRLHQGQQGGRADDVAHRDRALVPNVTRNVRSTELFFDGTTWPPGEFALHPGSAANTASSAGRPRPTASTPWRPRSRNIVVHGGPRPTCTSSTTASPCSTAFSTCRAAATRRSSRKTIAVKKGDTIDVVVGIGDGQPTGDTTALEHDPQVGRRQDRTTWRPISPTTAIPTASGATATWRPARSPTRPPSSPIRGRRGRNPHAASAGSRIPAPRSGKTCFPTSIRTSAAAHGGRHPHAADDQRRRVAVVPLGIRHRQRPGPGADRAPLRAVGQDAVRGRRRPTAASSTSSWPTGSAGTWTTRSPTRRTTSASAWPGWPGCGSWGSTPSAPTRT